MSLEMAHKVILPPQKNYIPQFLKQRDINSYFGGGGEKGCSNLLLKEKNLLSLHFINSRKYLYRNKMQSPTFYSKEIF